MLSNTTLIVATGAGMAAGWFLRSFFPRAITRLRHASATSYQSGDSGGGLSDDDDMEFTDDGEYKMVIVVRQDLKMGKGKIASQCCHAAVGSVRKSARKHPEALRIWESCGQPKIVTKAVDEEQLISLAQRASELGLPFQLIRDAGRTQIIPGSLTTLAVGPGPNTEINKVTGALKLL